MADTKIHENSPHDKISITNNVGQTAVILHHRLVLWIIQRKKLFI